MRRILSLVLLVLVSTQTIWAKKEKQSENTLQGKQVIFVYGGWDGHEPAGCRDVFVPWLESEGAVVTVSDNLDIYLDRELMGKVDLIIQCWTMGTITPAQERALLNAVRKGAGIAGWHGGTGDSFRNSTDYQYMIGGQWVAHPDNIIDYTVNVTDHKDPVTKGLKDFQMHSEQYYMHVDPNVKVLATTTFHGKTHSWIEGRKMPVVWKTNYGEGKVFYSSLGHVASDFQVPEAFEIMKRGIRWAVK